MKLYLTLNRLSVTLKVSFLTQPDKSKEIQIFVPPQKAWRVFSLSSEPLNSQGYKGNLLYSVKMKRHYHSSKTTNNTLKSTKEQLIYQRTRY